MICSFMYIYPLIKGEKLKVLFRRVRAVAINILLFISCSAVGINKLGRLQLAANRVKALNFDKLGWVKTHPMSKLLPVKDMA